jgi:hypothetical protein
MINPTTAELVEYMNEHANIEEYWSRRKSARMYRLVADRLEELEQELATLREQQRWIPVTERLPEALEIVLTICVDRRKNSEIHRRINCCDAIGEWLITPPLYAVTHWMPLPEPPKEEVHESERVPRGN